MEEKNVPEENNNLWNDVKANINLLMVLKAEIIAKDNCSEFFKNAFKSVSETTKALQLMLFFIHENEISILKSIIEDLINTALEGSITNIQLARRVILQIDRDWLKSNLYDHTQNQLLNGDELSYRRAAELLKFLDLIGDLSKFLDKCQKNDNQEIQEIMEDFKKWI